MGFAEQAGGEQGVAVIINDDGGQFALENAAIDFDAEGKSAQLIAFIALSSLV